MMRIANVSVSCERVSQLVLNVAPSDKNIYIRHAALVGSATNAVNAENHYMSVSTDIWD